MTAEHKPFYFRWLWDGKSASVEVHHNHEDHPAEIQYINDLKHRYPHETDGGYAYNIDGGMRIVDENHKPLKDSYILDQVRKALHHA